MSDRTNFELTFTFDNNQVVRVSVDYEENQAMSAINALRQAGNEESLVGLISAMRDDPSVRATLNQSGLGFEDDEEYL